MSKYNDGSDGLPWANTRIAEPPYLTFSEKQDVQAITRWIDIYVPSVVGRLSSVWTVQVVRVLHNKGVPMAVIYEALGILERQSQGGRFEGLPRPYDPPNPHGHPKPPVLKEAEEEWTPESIRRTARIFEDKYILAVKTDDYVTHASVLSGFMSLMRNFVAAAMIGRKQKEHDDRQSAGEQLRLGAPTVFDDANRITRAGIEQPTPRDVQYRLEPARLTNQRRRTRSR